MNSLPSLPDMDDRELRLPAHCSTTTAEDLRVRLVLAADFDDTTEVDASGVESIGQAALQLLLAARHEALSNGRGFTILDPSPAFVERVTGACLAEALGIEPAKG